ncbi:MAG: DPP IV N-terminal domain-containing protein [Verrucomicrobiales bacterium]|nr:DPP IV N-terminal domain-containing protein [Verrucomicrobiales bacterium]
MIRSRSPEGTRTWLLRSLLFLFGLGAVAQGSQSDYERALGLAGRTEDRVFRQRIRPEWLPGAASLWYRVPTGPNARQWVLVHAVTGHREPLFDHDRLASGLSRLLGKPVAPEQLPLEQLAVEGEPPGPVSFRFRADGRRWIWSPAAGDPVLDPEPDPGLPLLTGDRAPKRSRASSDETRIVFRNESREDLELFWLDTEGVRKGYGRLRPGQERSQHTYVGHVFLLADRDGSTVAVFEAAVDATQAVVGPDASKGRPARAVTPEPGLSPDAHWVAFLEGNNLHLRSKDTGEVRSLTSDGTAEDPYRAEVQWSPDSTRLVATRLRPGGDRQVSFVEAAPRDQLQPKLHTHRYLKPGDPLPKPRLRLLRVAGPGRFAIDDALYPNPFTEDGDLNVRWAPDSRSFFFDYNQRGHQRFRILAVDVAAAETQAASGSAGWVTVKPRIVVEETSETFIDWTNKTWRHWLDATGELLWMSERDGWAHLWLYDAQTGSMKGRITRGNWVVREILHVDDAAREVWFLAGGVRPEQDPYQLHLCRVNFDGSGFTVLTDGDGTHKIEFSPDRRWFLDTWSRVDLPPRTELRKSTDGSRVCVLEEADISALLAAGWTTPERFVAPGRDGATPIHGILIRPSNFDPALRYPVVEEIYAGPHGAFVPKEFGRLLRQHAIAELGFIVVQIDGMGTNHRGKKFHDVAWKNLADSGLPDHIAWLKAAASTRPWMDLSRVGIYGGSAGGQSSTRALLDHGDFYRVAVSDCGCHDNRMDKIWWNEQWLGWPVDESYRKCSNVEDAARLQGHLLLIVGEMDTNVDPASTLQVAAALVRADKDFELLIMPGSDHGAAESPYGIRRRMDFFVRHLLGREPRWR